MRHAFATLPLDADEEIAVISKMLGHADFSTTVDVLLAPVDGAIACRGRAHRRTAQAA
jgi:site-specific recombinase XerC